MTAGAAEQPPFTPTRCCACGGWGVDLIVVEQRCTTCANKEGFLIPGASYNPFSYHPTEPPLDLDEFLSRDRGIDVHTVITMLAHHAVNTENNELAFLLRCIGSREHRADNRLSTGASAWVTARALECVNPCEDGAGGKISLAHKFAAEGDIVRLRSLVAAGVPAWRLLLVEPAWAFSPLSRALAKGAPTLPAVVDLFLDAASFLGSPPLPAPQCVVAAGEQLPRLLTEALYSAVRYNRVAVVARLLTDFPLANPAWSDSACLRDAARRGHTEVVALLLADGRAQPSAMRQLPLRMAASNGHAEVVALLLGDPRVDPTAEGGRAATLAALEGHKEVVRLLEGAVGRREVVC